ncbi:histidinol-phosphate aminotransferase 4 (plasmid) [Rhizobium gallicum]|uniref:Histidinol-phosphate aminotransferase n=1 Tax=Rhizobium gallicum TaxID=56730 RepID=A0A1L5NSD3_9HYPH|nr:aminotransferase class I/II-fold pyridoxal phosphate-dependent enzyme [Rhizobium gallicum]APO70749.1 histidinol-phosphate aminotransferase 4 [Rhizobium gallicum]ULJ75775.1 aminotransferase class I/II-fold pyridoxal phosphate-dependent enzyme [Rhizobium gallicum]
MRTKLRPNERIASLPDYNAGLNLEQARLLSGCETVAALASNENPYGCSPLVLEMLGSRRFDPSRYSDPNCTALRSALSASLGVPEELIVAGNGSEELIAAISRGFLVEGAKSTTVAPSFGLHEIDPLAAGGVVAKVPMTSQMSFDVDALEAELAAAPALFFLPSPSNPVGPALTSEEMARLVRATRPQTLFVLDQAYIEFVADGYPDGLSLLGRPNFNCVLLRTFSKAYGLAGLRVGYAICSDRAIARVVAKAKPPFNVNAAAQMAAIAALSDQEWMKSAVTRVVAERGRLASRLSALGLRVADSQTNFLFFRTAMPGTTLAESLLKDGIVVKPWREAGYTNWSRVTVGTPAENDRFLASVANIIGGSHTEMSSYDLDRY